MGTTAQIISGHKYSYDIWYMIIFQTFTSYRPLSNAMSDRNDRGWNIINGEPRNTIVAQLLWQTKDGQIIPPLWAGIAALGILFSINWGMGFSI